MRHLISAPLLLLFITTGCRDDEEISTQEKTYNLNGYVQKGPFINGTAITVSELDKRLVATGKNFTTQIVDNKGAFSLRDVKLQSDFVQLIAEGFYFDEVRGEKSAAQLTLFALADVSNASSVNVNLLSHLEKDRVTYLMQEEEKSFSVAKQQAQREILSIFGIEKANMIASELLDISQDSEDNAVLLAISAILQGNNSVAELSELLADIITDIREDGTLNSESTREKIRSNAMVLRLTDIRQHLEVRYEELGVDATIPNFEQYVDSDGDGFLNKDEDDTPDDFAFESQVAVAVDAVVVSNEIVISGLKEGGIAYASVNNGWLVVNGVVVPQDAILADHRDTLSVASVKNGDQLQVQLLSSSQFADTISASLTIGTLTKQFRAVTDDYSPDAFSFASIEDASLDTIYRSKTITLAGLPHETLLKNLGGNMIDGALFINGKKILGTDTIVRTGDQLVIEIYFSQFENVAYQTIYQYQVMIGLSTYNFQVITKNDPWEEKAAFPGNWYPDYPYVVFATNSKVYAGGNYSFREDSRKLYEYDIQTDKWSLKSEFPGEVHDLATIGVLGGKAYIPFDFSLWEYDINGNNWTEKTQTPIESEKLSNAFAINNSVYFVSDSSIWQYNPGTNAWIHKGLLPYIYKYKSVAFSVDGMIFITGPESWMYNPQNDTWIRKNDSGFSSTDRFFTIQNTAYCIDVHLHKYSRKEDTWHQIEPYIADPGFIKTISSPNKGYNIDGSRFYEFTPPQD